MKASAHHLLKFLAWLSPAFPVGAYSYSHGLEWSVESGAIRDAASLQTWIEDILRCGAGRSDAILFDHIHRAPRAEQPALADLAAVLQPSRERAFESLAQGRAFIKAIESAWPSPGAFDHIPDPTYPIAVAVAAAAHGLPIDLALPAYLHAFSANLVSAGVRLIPLGQTDGLKILSALEPIILTLAAEAQTLGLDALGSCAILSDIASMRHETQYTRLFRT